MFDSNNLRSNQVRVKVDYGHFSFRDMLLSCALSEGTSEYMNDKFLISASIGSSLKAVIKVTITPLAICEPN